VSWIKGFRGVVEEGEKTGVPVLVVEGRQVRRGKVDSAIYRVWNTGGGVNN